MGSEEARTVKVLGQLPDVHEVLKLAGFQVKVGRRIFINEIKNIYVYINRKLCRQGHITALWSIMSPIVKLQPL